MNVKPILNHIGKVVVVAFFAFTSSRAICQTSTLNNQSVLDLVKAGLDRNIIIATINSAVADFDLSADGLIALKNAKVDDSIIAAMVTKSNSGDSAAVAKVSAPSGGVELLNHPYHDGKPINKATGSVSTKARALGYGGANSQYEVDGARAKFRIAKGSELAFVVNTGGEAPELTLYRAENKKDKRIVVLASVRMFSGAKMGGGSLSVSTSALGNGVYKIIPSEDLEAGEYFFVAQSVGTTVSVSDAFAFGIDE